MIFWCRVLLLHCILPLCLAVNNRRGVRVAGIMNYSTTQLMEYNNYNTPSCISVIKELGLLCQPHYTHRSAWRKFVYSRSGDTIPSVWAVVRPVASLPRHQSTDTPWISSTGDTATAPHIEMDRKCGVDLSLLQSVQRLTALSNIKIELFNTKSLTNKSCFIHDHIRNKSLDIMCLTETWQNQMVFFLF